LSYIKEILIFIWFGNTKDYTAWSHAGFFSLPRLKLGDLDTWQDYWTICGNMAKETFISGKMVLSYYKDPVIDDAHGFPG